MTGTPRKEDKRLFLTPEGAAKLRDELKELTGPRRKAIADRLHHAVRQGDLSENAEYRNHSAPPRNLRF